MPESTSSFFTTLLETYPNIKITPDLSQWKSFDLSPEFHNKQQADWKRLYEKNTTLARTWVQAQTLAYIKDHPSLAVTKANLVTESDSIIASKPTILAEKHSSVITVEPMDCLYIAEKFAKQGKKVAVLNMANQFHKGGGYLNGAGAQEEDLFRRTNLIESVEEKFYLKNADNYENSGFGEFNTLYSDKVTVFRNGQDKNYTFLSPEEQFTISVISGAAYNLKYSKVKEGTTRYLSGTRRKIKMQLETALQQGHKNLVLSAFGCGAFENNPDTIARTYRELLARPRYQAAFEQVVFAIVPNPGCNKDNYLPFKDVICADSNPNQPSAFQPTLNQDSYWSWQQLGASLLGAAAVTALFALIGIPGGLLLHGIIGVGASFAVNHYFFHELRPKNQSNVSIKNDTSSSVVSSSVNTEHQSEPSKSYLPSKKPTSAQPHQGVKDMLKADIESSPRPTVKL